MAAGRHDRLSELPDDLLRRILHFAPLKEAASTTALSRRWRAPLWLSSGALNLEVAFDNNTRFFCRPDDVFTAAKLTLDAADAPVTRLTLRHSNSNVVPDYRYTDLVDVVLSHRAVRRVKELRIVAKDPNNYYYKAGLYEVTLDYRRLQRLRVLQLHNCQGILFKIRQHAVLQRLSSLGLSYGVQHLGSLQRLIDSAPALSAVRLESVIIDATPEEGKEATTRRLSCPTANVLVLDTCTWQVNDGRTYSGGHHKKTVYVDEINAPRLRRFKYHGSLRSFPFSPQPQELEQLDLDLSRQGYEYEWNYKKDRDLDLDTFWRATWSFTSTRKMRLRVNKLEDIAVLSEPRRVELLPAFRWLQHLEVQGLHLEEGKIATVMTILNLLRCCPVLSTLWINLTAKHTDTSNKKVSVLLPQKEIQIAAMLGPSHFYQCLQSSLRGVCLQFRLEKSDCIGEKLIKFFADKAMVLEEMRIDAGDEKLCEDMKTKAEKWNSRRTKIGATSFVVLPLKSGLYQEWKI